MPIVESVIWSSLILYFLWRAEILYKDWLKKQQSVSDKQVEELNKRIAEVQSQVNSLVMQKDYDS